MAGADLSQLSDGDLMALKAGDLTKMSDAGLLTLKGQGEVTAADRGKAALGGVNRGIAGLVGSGVDTAENLVNLGIAGAGSLATAAGRPDLAPQPMHGSFGGSEWLAKKMGGAGIQVTNPRPDDSASRMLNTAGTIAGGSMVPGAGIKNTLAAATGGALTSEALGPEYAGVGAMVPAAASQAAGAVRQAVADKTRPNLEAFKKAGTTPTVGQATESSFIRGLENLIKKFPGGVGVMSRFAENQQAQIGAKARTGVSAEDAGRVIEKGITGEGGFLARTKAEWNKLDADLAAKVPQSALSKPTQTLQALDELTAATAGAEKTTGALVNPKLAEMRQNLLDDLQASTNGIGRTDGALPFEALRALRSRVGGMLDDTIVSGIPGGELKKVYGALSSDLEAAATQAGAGKEFARQNNYYRARMGRVEDVLDRVVGKGKMPEDVFKAFVPTDPDQANKVRAVLRSLHPDERRVVSEAVINRLGRATPGKQNELGEVFSTETFLTNWNKMSEAAKAQLFPNHSMRANVDAIARTSGNLREGSKAFANPSGSAGAAAPYGLGAMAATGNYLPAAGMIGSAYIGAKMLTSPRVVEWLAKAPNVKEENMAPHLARLAVIFNQSNDDGLKQELSRFMEDASQK